MNIAALLLLFLLVSAVCFDVRFRRIPNLLIVIGWVAGLIWHITGFSGHWAFDPSKPGAVGAVGALLSSLVLLLAFLPLYVLRIMGAGDVKLMSVVGMFFGASGESWTQLIGVSLSVLIAGGVLAVARLFYFRSGAAVLGNLRLMFSCNNGRMLGMPAPTFDARTDSADRMPYAVAIAAGTIFYLVAKWAGWIKWI